MEQPIRISEEEALQTLATFFDDKKSLFMSTVDENGEPFISYAPYVSDEKGDVYIYISGNVPHAHNLVKVGKVSIMMIEDEKDAGHIYGRRRFYASAKAEKFEENDPREAKINELFEQRFGKEMRFATKMPDFRIYKLTLGEGNLVLGFGSAYKISPDRKTIHIKNAVHERKHEENI